MTKNECRKKLECLNDKYAIQSALFVIQISSFLRASTFDIRHLKLMNIGFVGVGRMGANMARHLKDRQFQITAVYDINRAKATSIAAEVGCAASQDLSEVKAASDVIFREVTDDYSVRQIFTGAGDNLLVNARWKFIINFETIQQRV